MICANLRIYGEKIEYQLIGCSLNNGKTLIILGYTKIIRQPYNKNTGYLVLSPIENLDYNSEVLERFLSTIGYNGLFSLEFIRDKNDRDYFLKINLRDFVDMKFGMKQEEIFR